VEDYSWTPVNAPVKEILMEIKKDPGYKDPPSIKGRSLPHSLHKYCHYHDSYGHWTNTCVALREMIERYIADGKLTDFLGKRKNQTDEPPLERVPGNRNLSRREVRPRRQQYYQERKRAQLLRIDTQKKKAPQREWSKSRGRPNDSRDFPEIRTIAGGFGGGSETYLARKSYAKEMREESIMQSGGH
jgi:hypothetical protein